MATLLNVENLEVKFQYRGHVVNAVNGVSYVLQQGESLGIIGESGSGKTVSVLSLLRLVKGNGVIKGKVVFQNKDLLSLSRKELREVRGKDIGIIFQDPTASLNPVLPVGRQIMEPLLWHNMADRGAAFDKAVEMMEIVGIPDSKRRIRDYPFQFSGGMRQRIMIATALVANPRLLIADEPTTSLDVTIQAQILNLLLELKRRFNMAVILISHDFGVISNFCERIITMYAGHIVETGNTRDFAKPYHPYTRGLLASTLEIGKSRGREIAPIPGEPPNPIQIPNGCPFHPRCYYADEKCRSEFPSLREVNGDHMVACWKAEEVER